MEADLARRGPCRDKVLATAVRLLEITLIRVGNALAKAGRRSNLVSDAWLLQPS